MNNHDQAEPKRKPNTLFFDLSETIQTQYQGGSETSHDARQSTLKMITADYCGTGVSRLCDGICWDNKLKNHCETFVVLTTCMRAVKSVRSQSRNQYTPDDGGGVIWHKTST